MVETWVTAAENNQKQIAQLEAAVTNMSSTNATALQTVIDDLQEKTDLAFTLWCRKHLFRSTGTPFAALPTSSSTAFGSEPALDCPPQLF